jgi:hypothetical protein
LTASERISHSSSLDVVAVAQIAGGCAGCVARFRGDAQLRRQQQWIADTYDNSGLWPDLPVNSGRTPGNGHFLGYAQQNSQSDAEPDLDAVRAGNHHLRPDWIADAGSIQCDRHLHQKE